MGQRAALIAMVAAFVVPGMTIIDGIVRTQRTRNIPPRGPEIVGR